MYVKAVWTWNRTYQEVYERMKSLVKDNTCMKYHGVRKPLYLKTDTSGVRQGVTLLKVRDNLNCAYDEAPDSTMFQAIMFAVKSLFSAQW